MQQRLGITTVYVTHDQTEAMTLGDRVAVLRKGVLQQVGDAPGALRAAGQPVRGRLHRLPADELHARRRAATARLELPFVTVRPARATCASGRDPRARDDRGIRPEHFEDASVMDGDKADGASPSRADDRRDRVAGQRAVRLHPLRAPPTSWRRQPRGARQRTSTASAMRTPDRRRPRLGQPHRRRRGGRALVRPAPHAPLRAATPATTSPPATADDERSAVAGTA